MSKTIQYFRTVATNQDIKAVYDSETNEITITIERQLMNGASIGSDSIKIHPTYVEPLKKLLDEVAPPKARRSR